MRNGGPRSTHAPVLSAYERQQTLEALAFGAPRILVDWKCSIKQWEVRAGREVERQLITEAENERSKQQ